MQERHRRFNNRNLVPPPPLPPSTSYNEISSDENRGGACLPTINETCCEDNSPPGDIEDLFSTLLPENDSRTCPSRFGCQNTKRQQCQGVMMQYQQQIDDDLELIEEEPESHEPQLLRHTVLLILLLCSMFVVSFPAGDTTSSHIVSLLFSFQGLALSIWTLVMEQMSGIYIELSFLDATLNFGQSIIIFGIFGLDTKEVVLPVLKLWRHLYYGANTLVLPSWQELSPETRHICDQFLTHHLQSCRDVIAQDKRWRLRVYKDVFTGSCFIDWLIDVGLARDRGQAVSYGRHLIEGKVLRHINGVYHFYDRNLLYTFNN